MEMNNLWKAQNWDPDRLIGLYKKAGAKYFVSLANHHDNFDNYESSHLNRPGFAGGPIF
jgi:alpha-L-fucosidase